MKQILWVRNNKIEFHYGYGGTEGILDDSAMIAENIVIGSASDCDLYMSRQGTPVIVSKTGTVPVFKPSDGHDKDVLSNLLMAVII